MGKECVRCNTEYPLSGFKKYTYNDTRADMDEHMVSNVCKCCMKEEKRLYMVEWRRKERLKRDKAKAVQQQAMRHPSDNIPWAATVTM